jgi:ABC-2 type transport system ATP-binding protein/lipopolysaccharide transport system ATP-binding protein
MNPTVIEIRGLGKRYVLGQQQAAYGSLRESLASAMRPGRREHGPRSEVWALRDVDLDVLRGESVGVIGANGAGKSTLLKILSRITEPSAGVVRTRGRVGCLLEVGTGFHPELTGRENVFLSGAVMGMSRRDVRRHYDDIVEFSGVERFLDTPLKRYSSGMQLRLAFAVAAHLEPELMLVDEVLAVGDLEFQRRCLQRMDRLSDEGRTVIFVSHDLGAITRLCTRAIWVDRGHIVADGPPAEIVERYYASVIGGAGRADFDVHGEAGVVQVEIVDKDGELLPQPERGRPFAIQARLIVRADIPELNIAMHVMAGDGTVVFSETWSDQPDMPTLAPAPGDYLVRLGVPAFLPAGDYVVGLWLGTAVTGYVDTEAALRFSVRPRAEDRQEWLTRRRTVQPTMDWSCESVEVRR